MLFDLRGRGRRRTVQTVYLGLALLMFGGLVLFGVGAGNGFGGLLNAFTGQGSGSAQSQVVSQAEKTALAETRQRPSEPQAWADLVQARWTTASNPPDFNTTNGTFSANGRKELAGVTQAWERYVQLTRSPDPTIAIISARAYGGLGQYGPEARAWEIEANANPSQPKGWECLAVSAYAAGQNRKGALAAQKALSLVPSSQRVQLNQAFQAAKANPQIAASC